MDDTDGGRGRGGGRVTLVSAVSGKAFIVGIH